jgi:hydrogenase maturation protease
VLVVRPDVLDVTDLPPTRRRDALADMHYATPERAFMLARALGVLPAATWVVGCQPADTERLGEGLSRPVDTAVTTAAAEVRRLVSGLGIPWP